MATSSTTNEENNESNETADELLSRELLKISLNDRNAIHEEIHGVRCLAVRETPELISKSLVEFQTELEALLFTTTVTPNIIKNNKSTRLTAAYSIILSRRKKAMKEAQINKEKIQRHNIKSSNSSKNNSSGKISSRKRHYAIDNQNFRLRFLRCELFDVQKAVIRFFNYFNFVYECFGEISLEREISLKDFKKDDRKFFRKGYFQVLPFRDRSGRRVVTILGGMGPNVEPMTRAKALFYVLDATTRDSAESQRSGAITVSEGSSVEDGITGSFQVPQQDLVLMKHLMESVPTRLVAVHKFWPDAPIYRFMAKLLTGVLLQGVTRLRLKFQIGDELEMKYHLKSYGIPIHLLAKTESGGIKVGYHNIWMKTRKLIEERIDENELEAIVKDDESQTNNNSTDGDDKVIVDDNTDVNSASNNDLSTITDDPIIVECPLLNDIAFRQGMPLHSENPGNSIFRELIVSHCGENQKEMGLSSKKKQGGTNQSCFSGKDVECVLDQDGRSMYNGSDDGDDDSDDNALSDTDRDRAFREWLIDEIQIKRKGRFLEWDKSLQSYVVTTNEKKIQRKVSVTIYNIRQKIAPMLLLRQTTTANYSHTDDGVVTEMSHLLDNDSSIAEPALGSRGGNINYDDDGRTYQFIEGGKTFLQHQQHQVCSTIIMAAACTRTKNDMPTNTESNRGKKRSRNNSNKGLSTWFNNMRQT